MAKSKKSAAPAPADSSAARPKARCKTSKACKPADTKVAAAPKATKEAAPVPAAKPKKATATTLSDKQRELLAKIGAAGATGYIAVGAGEARAIKSLVDRKAAKSGPKTKGSDKVGVVLTKTGEKMITAPSAT